MVSLKRLTQSGASWPVTGCLLWSGGQILQGPRPLAKRVHKGGQFTGGICFSRVTRMRSPASVAVDDQGTPPH